MAGVKKPNSPPSPHDETNDDGKQGAFGVQNETDQNSAPQKLKKGASKTKEQNRTDSFFPGGIPKSMTEDSTKLVYEWDGTKNKERQDRDPVNKPVALPFDDEYLSILPSDSANVAWQHLKSEKQRPSLEDFNETPEPVRERKHAQIQDQDDKTGTANPVLRPADIQPTPRQRTPELKGKTAPNNAPQILKKVPPQAPRNRAAQPSPAIAINAPSLENADSGAAATTNTEAHLQSAASPPIPGRCWREPGPNRRTLMDRTADYKLRICRPVKVTPIHPLPGSNYKGIPGILPRGPPPRGLENERKHSEQASYPPALVGNRNAKSNGFRGSRTGTMPMNSTVLFSTNSIEEANAYPTPRPIEHLSAAGPVKKSPVRTKGESSTRGKDGSNKDGMYKRTKGSP